MAEKSLDRLYNLLPAVYRRRDAEQGYPLRALLQVIAEQVNVIEDDMDQLYDDWFIETCQDWVVPYIGDLVGYRPVSAAGLPGDADTAAGRQLNRMLLPRTEIANTIRFRRRKGTLALIELLARDVGGWDGSRAVAFADLVAHTQTLNSPLPGGGTVSLTDARVLEDIDGPFDTVAHTVDVRRIDSPYTRGRYNLPSVGLFVWRLNAYSVTQTEARRQDDMGTLFTFSILGNNAPLFTRPDSQADPTAIATRLHVPAPITRTSLDRDLDRYYGQGRSLVIWTENRESGERRPLPMERIVVADLSDDTARPVGDNVAVDPELGRIAIARDTLREFEQLWVSYHYGFSDDLGGGEYERPIHTPPGAVIYRVVRNPQDPDLEFATLAGALRRWRMDRPCNAVIEFVESRFHNVASTRINLGTNQTLQIRAAAGARPVLRVLDDGASNLDAVYISGVADEAENITNGSEITLDGLLILGRSVRLGGTLAQATIRHCTLLPGWELDKDCYPQHRNEPSLVLTDTTAAVDIQHTILGTIRVDQNARMFDPVPLCLADSILDATEETFYALGETDPDGLAFALLMVLRTTVIGQVRVHAIALGENTIFDGNMTVARRQVGCLRFCYVPFGSRTPVRYHCQPDLARAAVHEQLLANPDDLTDEEVAARQAEVERQQARETLRVRPHFHSERYGRPAYVQLADHAPEEIKRGADDGAEMGVFHDLYQPQRTANLLTRLAEYMPAGKDTGIIFVT